MPTFIVRCSAGANWLAGQPPWKQPYWNEHGSFINALQKEGFFYMGGTLADFSGTRQIVEAHDREAVAARLSQDPWVVHKVVTVDTIEEWLVLMDPRRNYEWPLDERWKAV